LGHTVGDRLEAVAENHRRVLAAFDLTPEQVVSPYQVHGCHVARVAATDGGTVIPETDALITAEPGLALLLRFADCAPVLFYDPVHHAMGLAHAGWRGVAAQVAPATVRAMAQAFGTRPAELWAGIGPAIGPERYAVGPEVVAAVRATLSPASLSAASLSAARPVAVRRQEQWYLDIPQALTRQLHAAGVGRVANAALCTASHTEAWYSHRAEHGRTGRFGVLARLR
jgi:hypothetical protein